MNEIEKIEVKENYEKNSEGKMILNKLQVDKTYEGEQGQLTTTFHYVAGKESGISDGDTYVTISLTHEFPFGSSYEELHESKVPLYSSDSEFWTLERLEHTRPISEEEYVNRNN